jgi:hypothetical protein
MKIRKNLRIERLRQRISKGAKHLVLRSFRLACPISTIQVKSKVASFVTLALRRLSRWRMSSIHGYNGD